MSRINGVGTTWLGQTGRDEQDRCYATMWFTFFFAPILPIRRSRLQLLPHEGGSGFTYAELERTPLVSREILGTVLFSWLLVPVVLGGPLVPAVEEVRVKLGIPASWQIPWLVVGLVWWGVFLWKLSDWHEERYRPRTTK